MLASSNKCLEGPPGIGFALIDRPLLEAAADRNPSLSLDLHAQWRGFEADGQWRFTPPVQVVAGLVEALRLLQDEGGPAARLARYQRRFDRLAAGLEGLGYSLYLDRALQSPIIATFRPRPGKPFDLQSLDPAAAAGLRRGVQAARQLLATATKRPQRRSPSSPPDWGARRRS